MFGLAGCGDNDRVADEAKVADLEAAVAKARDGVVHDVAAAAQVSFISGTVRSNWCGESYAPRGVLLSEDLRFGPSPLTTVEALDAVEKVLDDQGWTVRRGDNPPLVTATSGGLEIRVKTGGAAFLVEVHNPDCVETGDDVAREFADRKASDVAWQE